MLRWCEVEEGVGQGVREERRRYAYIQGMEHYTRESGDRACAENAPEAPCFEGGSPRLMRRGRFGFRMVRGWNGMESSRVPQGAGQRGSEIDNAIPRLPLPPSTVELAPPVASIFFFAPGSFAPAQGRRVLEMLTP